MKLASYVKPQKGFLKVISSLVNSPGQLIGQRIYLSQAIYEDLQKNNPDPKNIGVLLHEETHYKEARRKGWLKWGTKYIFSSKFRLQEELRADKVQMKYLKKRGVELNLEKRARSLSGWVYFNMVPYEMAKNKLQRMWKDI